MEETTKVMNDGRQQRLQIMENMTKVINDGKDKNKGTNCVKDYNKCHD